MTWSKDPAYDKSAGANRSLYTNKDLPIRIELIDDVDVGPATDYYPSEAGMKLGRFTDFSIHGVISGGVTFTVWVKNDDSTDWIDITKSGYRLGVDQADAVDIASIVDEDFFMSFAGINAEDIRIKSVTSDGVNFVQYHIRLRV